MADPADDKADPSQKIDDLRLELRALHATLHPAADPSRSRATSILWVLVASACALGIAVMLVEAAQWSSPRALARIDDSFLVALPALPAPVVTPLASHPPPPAEAARPPHAKPVAAESATRRAQRSVTAGPSPSPGSTRPAASEGEAEDPFYGMDEKSLDAPSRSRARP